MDSEITRSVHGADRPLALLRDDATDVLVPGHVDGVLLDNAIFHGVEYKASTADVNGAHLPIVLDLFTERIFRAKGTLSK